VAVLIPSIDLMGGKIVQLVQGEKKILEFDDFDVWVERFADFPLVQLIDLDAAIGTGSNWPLIQDILRRLPCQVGGGIRSIGKAQEVLLAGARRVIIGSVLVHEGGVNRDFAEQIAMAVGLEKLVFAVDAKDGKVAIRGWRERTELTPADMMRALEPWCTAFLYTNIDTEGLMRGIPFEIVSALRRATSRQVIVAGGISSYAEIEELDRVGLDAVVGMALYSGVLDQSARR
jgi:phosphoribosylformimino-5-aminoimidazole carboxamide ribotide isomerase